MKSRTQSPVVGNLVRWEKPRRSKAENQVFITGTVVDMVPPKSLPSEHSVRDDLDPDTSYVIKVGDKYVRPAVGTWFKVLDSNPRFHEGQSVYFFPRRPPDMDAKIYGTVAQVVQAYDMPVRITDPSFPPSNTQPCTSFVIWAEGRYHWPHPKHVFPSEGEVGAGPSEKAQEAPTVEKSQWIPSPGDPVWFMPCAGLQGPNSAPRLGCFISVVPAGETPPLYRMDSRRTAAKSEKTYLIEYFYRRTRAYPEDVYRSKDPEGDRVLLCAQNQQVRRKRHKKYVEAKDRTPSPDLPFSGETTPETPQQSPPEEPVQEVPPPQEPQPVAPAGVHTSRPTTSTRPLTQTNRRQTHAKDPGPPAFKPVKVSRLPEPKCPDPETLEGDSEAESEAALSREMEAFGGLYDKSVGLFRKYLEDTLSEYKKIPPEKRDPLITQFLESMQADTRGVEPKVEPSPEEPPVPEVDDSLEEINHMEHLMMAALKARLGSPTETEAEFVQRMGEALKSKEPKGPAIEGYIPGGLPQRRDMPCPPETEAHIQEAIAEKVVPPKKRKIFDWLLGWRSGV